MSESLSRPGEAVVNVLYRNYRGETAVRSIIPGGCDPACLTLWHGKTEWHPEPGFLLSAWDVEKAAHRDFAMSGILAWGDEAIAAYRAERDAAHAKGRAEGIGEAVEVIERKARLAEEWGSGLSGIASTFRAIAAELRALLPTTGGSDA